MRKTLASLCLHAALVAGAVLTLLPLVWMILASLMPAGEASSVPPRFFPSHVTFDHYRELFIHLNIGRVLFNSALLAVSVTVLSVLLNAMAGYAFAKLRFPGRGRIFGFLLGALVLPAQVAILPLFLLMRQLGLISSYWGVILPGMATIFGIFLVRQYALCRPILVTLAIFTFLGTWNDFFWPLVVLTDDSKYTLPVALANLFGEHVQDTELMMAGSVLTVMPVLLLFLALQRHYVQGLLMGSVKE